MISRISWGSAAKGGFAIILGLTLFAIVGPWVAPHDPYTSDFVRGASAVHTPIGPSRDFWLGADRIYRDEFARLAVGARTSLAIGFLATAIATAIGALVGIIAGWFEGDAGFRLPWSVAVGTFAAIVLTTLGHGAFAVGVLVLGVLVRALADLAHLELLKAGPRVNVDVVLMRTVDIGLAFPFLLLAMAIGAALEKTTTTTIVVVLGTTGWLGTARLVRAKTMEVRSLEFVQAARALGRSTPGILVHHVLPNVSGMLAVAASLSVAQMILAESVLGYLGVGLGPPEPTWGRMLFEAQEYYLVEPCLVAAPASAIVVAVLGFYLLGEGLKHATDARN